MERRRFLKTVSASSGLLAAGSSLWTLGCSTPVDSMGPGTDPGGDLPLPDGLPLPVPTTTHPNGLTIEARAGTVSLGQDLVSPVWMYNGSLPGPTLRARTGDAVRISLQNGLSEETIVHWHGLDVPDHSDGHPRWAVGPGASYQYDFTVRNRAGTYWYHPHPHERTAVQTHRGMAGFFIVNDGEEESVGLPSGAREVPLVIQDKRLSASGEIVYQPVGVDLMAGYLGDTAFVNGAPFPFLEVDRTLYRFRILNGSNARIYDLALSNGQAFVLIGNDGGLLDRTDSLESVLLGPAERLDVLVDFSGASPGDRILLQSRPFTLSSGPPSTQGAAMDLMTFVVSDAAADPVGLPAGLPALPTIPATGGARLQTFEFTSRMGAHLINGRSFDVERVDAQVPLGDAEIWRFTNFSGMPHPVHMHAGQFRVLSRSGGRGQVFPWERGLKDTVLLLPFESVDVAVLFPEFRGLYLLHCHNLEHEDAGMMLNFEVV